MRKHEPNIDSEGLEIISAKERRDIVHTALETSV